MIKAIKYLWEKKDAMDIVVTLLVVCGLFFTKVPLIMLSVYYLFIDGSYWRKKYQDSIKELLLLGVIVEEG